MGARTGIGRAWKAALLVVVGAAGGGAALAVASVPDSNGVIHACYSIAPSGTPQITNGPNLTVIDPSAGQVCDTTTSPAGLPPTQAALSWNQQGPTGARGPTGLQGSRGLAGPRGSRGAPGARGLRGTTGAQGLRGITGALGPQGPTGAQGALGNPGAPGARGATGPQGRTVTIAGGSTFTIGGSTITVGSAHGVTIFTPAPTRNQQPAATMQIADGTKTAAGTAGGPLTFDVLSFSFGGSGVTGGHGGGGGSPSIHDVVITKKLDAATPKLIEALHNAQHFPTVTLTETKRSGSQSEFLRFTFTRCDISSYQVNGSRSSAGFATETLSLAFTKMAVTYVKR